MKVRGLAANTALALAGGVASKAGALLVVLLAARLFAVGEFAVVATALAFAGLLATALDLGAGTLLARDGASSAASRGALLRGLLEARAPLFVALLVSAPLVGVWLGDPLTALAVAGLSIAGALALSVLGLYRSCQDIGPEAVQKLVAALLASAAVLVCGVFAPRADVLLGALALVTLVTLVPLVVRLPAVADLSDTLGPMTALRRAAPIGLIALATVAYYRSGTIALAALGDAHETAAFSVAAGLAFGLLMLPNAITTALLPRLAVERGSDGLLVCTRRALAWTLAIAVPMAAVAAAFGPVAIPFLLGPEYTTAGPPFALLCLGIPIIAASGVIGTAVLALGRLRALGVQVGFSLFVNLVALTLLVPRLESIGAALATVICELAGLLLLVLTARRALPGLLSIRWISSGRPVTRPAAASPERAIGA